MIQRHIELGRVVVAASGVDWSAVRAVGGIACGGPLDPETGVIEAPPHHLPGWHEVPLAQIVGDALDRPVAVDNDDGRRLASGGSAPGGRGMSHLVCT